MFTGSLRGRLLWWLLLPLAAFVSISGVISYRFAQTTADLVQDNALLSSMRRAILLMEQHIGQPLSLSELAHRLEMSVRQIERANSGANPPATHHGSPTPTLERG